MSVKEDLSITEEEVDIFVEFEDNVNIEKYGNIHVLGIDATNPIIQLDDTFFLGTFESPLGTYLFFDDNPNAQSNDALFDKLPERNLKFFTQSRKSIKAEHVYVKLKEGSEQEYQKKPMESEIEITPTTFTSVPDAIDQFKKEWMKTYPDFFNKNEEASKNL